jgi:drug/metabolite transporter (DMT)-like permease
VTASLWAAGSALAFSVEGLLARAALGAGASLLGAIAARYAVAAAVAWCALALRREAGGMARADTLRLLALGALGYGGTTTLLFLAFVRIPTSLAIVLLYAYPALVALGGHLLGRERLTPGVAAAAGAAILGVALVSAPGGGAELVGVLAAFAAAALNAATVLGSEPVLARCSPLAGTARLVLAAALATGLGAVAAGQRLLPPAGALPSLVGLALVPTLAAVLLLNRSLQAVGATRTAVIATLEPIFAAVWGLLLLGEHLQALQWWGAALTVAGATAVSVLPHRHGRT